MTGKRWNPTPPGWKPIPSPTPRARGEEAWRATRGELITTCELRDDTAAGAGWEVVIRLDDEILIGRRCERADGEVLRERVQTGLPSNWLDGVNMMTLRIEKVTCPNCGKGFAIRAGAMPPGSDPSGSFEQQMGDIADPSREVIEVDAFSEDHVEPRCPYCGVVWKSGDPWPTDPSGKGGA